MSRLLNGRPGALEWDKEGDGVRQVRAHLELPSGVTLTGAPTVRIDKLTRGSEPEDWVDVTSTFTISGIVIVNAVADNGTTNLGTSQAVQFQIDEDLGIEPDETDAPTPGDEYRVVITATRSDAGEWVGKVPLIVHF